MDISGIFWKLYVDDIKTYIRTNPSDRIILEKKMTEFFLERYEILQFTFFVKMTKKVNDIF